MIDAGNHSYEFGPYRLIPGERQLLRDDQLVALPPKAFDTLVILVRNSGHALKKEELIKQVWPDSFVEESNLNHNISVLRKAFADGQSGDDYLETVRGYGFRFKAEVRSVDTGAPAVMVRTRTRTHVVYRQDDAQSVELSSMSETGGARRNLVPIFIGLGLVVAVGITSFVYFRQAAPRAASLQPAVVVPVRSKHSPNPEAREAYLRGRYFWNKRTPDDINRAGWEFRRAAQIDPDYALAYVGLADCQLMGGSTPTVHETAKDLALKAIALDPEVAEAHATLAYYLGAVEWNWSEAEKEFEKSIALDPAYPTARHWHAYNLASLGRLDEALVEIQKARELDPVSQIINTDVGHMFYLSRRYEEAINQYLGALQINPDFRVARWRLGEAYVQVKRYEEAATELREAIALEARPNSGLELWEAHLAAVSGRREQALKSLSDRKADAEARGHAYYIAVVYAGLGDVDSTFAWLDKAVAAHSGELALIKVEPMLEIIRKDSRYHDLLRRMNLA